MSERELESFSCTEEWLEAVGASRNSVARSPLDPLWHERDRWRRFLWDRHFAALSDEDQMLFRQDRHPSLSWRYEDEAQAYADELGRELADVEFVAAVDLGRYHGDTLVLTVSLDREVAWRKLRARVPELFRGFEVKVVVAPTG